MLTEVSPCKPHGCSLGRSDVKVLDASWYMPAHGKCLFFLRLSSATHNPKGACPTASGLHACMPRTRPRKAPNAQMPNALAATTLVLCHLNHSPFFSNVTPTAYRAYSPANSLSLYGPFLAAAVLAGCCPHPYPHTRMLFCPALFVWLLPLLLFHLLPPLSPSRSACAPQHPCKCPPSPWLRSPS